MSSSKTNYTIQSLCECIINNNKKEFIKHLDTNIVLNTLHRHNLTNMTPIGYALYYKRPFFVNKLLEKNKDEVDIHIMCDRKRDLDGVDSYQMLSPFHCAVINGLLPLVEAIYERSDKKSELLKKYSLYRNMYLTPFQLAVSENHHEIYRYLITKSEELKVHVCYMSIIKIGDQPKNVLELAARNNQFNTVKFLLNLTTVSWENPDKNKLGKEAFLWNTDSPVYCETDGNINHPLYRAVESENMRMVSFLSFSACPKINPWPISSFSKKIKLHYRVKLEAPGILNISDKIIEGTDELDIDPCIICQENFKKNDNIIQACDCDCDVNRIYHSRCFMEMLRTRGVKCGFCRGYFEKYKSTNSKKRKNRK